MNNDPKNSVEDEITLKELFLKAKEYINELFKYWWLILIICLFTTGYHLYKHYNYVGTYNAELQFIVEGQNSGGGGLSNLLGSFGMNKNSKVNPYKILEVAQSTNLFVNLLSSKTSEGQILANRLIELYNLDEEWAKDDPEFAGFRFANDSIQIRGNQREQNAIKKLKKIVWGNKESTDEKLTEIILDDNTGLYTITTKTLDEDVSLNITSTLYDEIKNFFEIQAFANQLQLSSILQSKADSIKVLRDMKTRELGGFLDKNRGIVSNYSEATMKIIAQENMALDIVYAEVVKNKEMADVNLKDRQPLFMAIDTPFTPLSKSASSLIKNLILGIVLGIFIAVIIILTRKIYQDVMSA